ncbi:MAG: hypothetical protein QOK08_1751 [Actinomycetota bacterium]|nr:hypothetical protein [Actinomycetota bacterium]
MKMLQSVRSSQQVCRLLRSRESAGLIVLIIHLADPTRQPAAVSPQVVVPTAVTTAS